MSAQPHSALPPSAWVTRWAAHLPRAGTVLDVACGSGRHARWLSAQGFQVVGVDRDLSSFVQPPQGVELLQADIEAGPWPLAGRRFDGIVVTNYLHRPSFPSLLAALADDGILLYETFARGNEAYGRPSSPDFLLEKDELLRVVERRLTVVAFEQGVVAAPASAVVQRLAAVGPGRPWPPVLPRSRQEAEPSQAGVVRIG